MYLIIFFLKIILKLFKKKYKVPTIIPIFKIWIPNKEKNNILLPKYFLEKIKNLYSKIIWKNKDNNKPNITIDLFKKRAKNKNKKISEVPRTDSACSEVANEPGESNFLLFIKT